jgi:predicted kinase
MNAATYRELGRHARGAESGAIVDATFRLRDDRDAFHSGLGAAAGRRMMFVECRVPRAVVEQRAAARLADPGRTSDATPAIAVAQLSAFEPLDEVPAYAHIAVRTDRDPERVVDEIGDRLDRALTR